MNSRMLAGTFWGLVTAFLYILSFSHCCWQLLIYCDGVDDENTDDDDVVVVSTWTASQ